MNSNAEDSSFDLDRFVEAQRGAYDQALKEIRDGAKRSHWMWYVFPQVAGLGVSAMTKRYALRDADEARAYLRHPVLGPRLLACFEAVLQVENHSSQEIFGATDALKLRSSATLFASVSEPGSVFERVLTKHYEGRPDQRTLDLLTHQPSKHD